MMMMVSQLRSKKMILFKSSLKRKTKRRMTMMMKGRKHLGVMKKDIRR